MVRVSEGIPGCSGELLRGMNGGDDGEPEKGISSGDRLERE